jgi:hypothetical protein
MTRRDLRDTEIRAALETICTELAVIRKAVPVTRLRVIQAQERTGLTGLLSPALAELDDVSDCVSTIGEQVTAALAKLLE